MEKSIAAEHGSADMVRAGGNALVERLSGFPTLLKEIVEPEGFILPPPRNALEQRRQAAGHGHGHCTDLIFPAGTWKFQDNIVCLECRRPMQKYTLYRCRN